MAEHAETEQSEPEVSAHTKPTPDKVEEKPTEEAISPKKAVHPFAKSIQRAQRRRLFTILGVCVAALSILWGIIYYSTRSGILILESEKNFTVTLNGKAAKLDQEKDGVFIHARPGVYRLELSRDGYEPFIADIKIASGGIVKLRPIFSVLPKTTTTSPTTVDYVRPSLDHKSVYYLGDNRQTIYRVEIANKVQVPITTEPLQGVSDMQWTHSADVALIQLPDGYYLQEIPTYNFQNEVRVKITQPYISALVFDPNSSDRIAFVYSPPTGEHSLAFSNDRNITSFDRKADIGAITNPKLIWSPSSDYVLLIDRSGDPTKNNLWIYRTTDGQLVQLTTSGNVTDATFSPDSGTILYEVRSTDPSNPVGSTLSVMRPDGTDKKDLGIAGKVTRTAWKDASSFYLPDLAHNNLTLYQLGGSQTSIPFSFPSGNIQGMNYFPEDQVLLFYTAQSIYLSDLAK